MQKKLDTTAKNVWRYFFGSDTQGNDAFGLKIYKGAYGDENSKYGWTIDHTYPLNPNNKNGIVGADIIENMQPMSILANRQKANKLKGTIEFRIENRSYIRHFEIIENPFLRRKCRAQVGILKLNISGEDCLINDGYIYKTSNRHYDYEYSKNILILKCARLDANTEDGHISRAEDWKDVEIDEYRNIVPYNKWWD